MGKEQKKMNPTFTAWFYIIMGFGWIGLGFFQVDYIIPVYYGVGILNSLIGIFHHPKVKQKLRRKRSE